MVETVSVDTVAQHIENDDAAVVNVLAQEDFEDEHIPGTTNIPYDEAEQRFPEEFDADKEIIVYCLDETCQASPQVAETLEEMGFENVRDFEAGLVGWKEAGHETASTN